MNIERLRKVVDVIAANPQAFDMEVWHCGTEACFAGHAVDVMAREQGLSVSAQKMEGSPFFSNACCVGNGPILTWSALAGEYFDVDEAQQDILFDPTCWPDDFSDAYYFAQDLDDKAGMVDALRVRVEAFIASGGTK